MNRVTYEHFTDAEPRTFTRAEAMCRSTETGIPLEDLVLATIAMWLGRGDLQSRYHANVIIRCIDARIYRYVLTTSGQDRGGPF